jgi:hypothetical protein
VGYPAGRNRGIQALWVFYMIGKRLNLLMTWSTENKSEIKNADSIVYCSGDTCEGGTTKIPFFKARFFNKIYLILKLFKSKYFSKSLFACFSDSGRTPPKILP